LRGGKKTRNCARLEFLSPLLMESHEVDADVLIVAHALGEMRNGVPPSSDTVEGPASSGLAIDPRFRSYSQTGACPSVAFGVDYRPDQALPASTPSLSVGSSSSRSTISETATTDQGDDSTFVSRMSNFPLVTSAIRVYEQGKASSRVVKFGAEMMEGTVKTMTRPVMDRLPVNQLDEFACRQLDRFGRYGGKPEDSPPPQTESHSAPPSKNSLDPALSPRGRKHLWIDSDARVPTSRDSSVAPGSDTGWSPTSTRFHSESHWATVAQAQNQSSSSGQEVQVINRSKWQAVLLEAGGIGAAVSEESMKRLKYCLQWLQVSMSLVYLFTSRDA
jgi:Transcription factor Opi1